MASALPRRAESGLTIGQVIAAVRAEFPELTQSKLRFLEEQGIVRPTRTASSYRMFRPADVERLRTALALQRDHFLPLREIRAHLDALDAGAATPLPITPTERLTRADLLRVTGAAGDLLDAAIEVGLIAGAQVYHAEARTVLVALVALEAVGIAPGTSVRCSAL